MNARRATALGHRRFDQGDECRLVRLHAGRKPERDSGLGTEAIRRPMREGPPPECLNEEREVFPILLSVGVHPAHTGVTGRKRA